MPDGLMIPPVPRLAIATAFIEALTGSPGTVMRLRFIYDSDRDNPAVEREGAITDLWQEIGDFQGRGYGVFYFLNVTKSGDGSGYNGATRDDDVSAIRALATDHDDGLPDDWEHRRKPDIVVRTSRVIKDGRDVQKGQLLWRIADCPVSGFKEAQRRLATHYGSDPSVSNPSRVLRLPGTLHLKDPSLPQLVTFDAESAGPPHRLAEIMEGLPEVATTDAEPRNAPAGVRFEDRPADIAEAIRRIESFKDKHGPPVEGAGSDSQTLALAHWLGDLPISDEATLDLLCEHWAPHFDREWIEAKTVNSGRYRRNGRGCDPVTGADRWSDRLPTGEEPAAHPRINLLSIRDVMAQPDPTELVEGMLMEGENVAVVGPPKSGKSFLAIDLGLSLAANLPVVGKHAVKRSGHVIYLSGEGHAGMKRRFLAWGRRRGLSLAEIEALPFHYNKGVPLAAESIAEAQAFVDAIRRKIGADPVLVIIDTMARSLGALDENTAAAAAQYLALTEMLRDQLNCTTLTLAHATNKPGTKAIDFRGSSGFSAGFDSVWTLDKSDENATVEMRGKYFKDADDLGPFYFRLESLEDGGAVLVPAEPPARNGGIEGSFLVEHLRAAMIERGVAGWRNALTDEELAERLAGPEPDPDPAKSQEENAKAQSGWVVKVARQKKMLQTGAVGRPDRRGGRYSARYAGRFRDSIKYSQAMEAVGRELRISQQPGGRKPAVVRLWCVPDEEAEIPF